LGDSYIENTYKCHLVISREGIYTIEVNKIYDVDNFREYMKNIHIKLLNFIRDDDIIFFDMARLEMYMRRTQNITIKLNTWNLVKNNQKIMVNNTFSSEIKKNYEDFDRRELETKPKILHL
jgi:hypothetical protein